MRMKKCYASMSEVFEEMTQLTCPFNTFCKKQQKQNHTEELQAS